MWDLLCLRCPSWNENFSHYFPILSVSNSYETHVLLALERKYKVLDWFLWHSQAFSRSQIRQPTTKLWKMHNNDMFSCLSVEYIRSALSCVHSNHRHNHHDCTSNALWVSMKKSANALENAKNHARKSKKWKLREEKLTAAAESIRMLILQF